MKKLSLYMLAFAGLFMTSCGLEDNEFAGLTTVQPDGAIVVPGFTAGSVDLIDLNSVEISGTKDIQLFTLSETALPEGVELSKGEVVFEDGSILKTTSDGKISGEELSAYAFSKYGYVQEAQTLNGTVYLYAVQNGSAVKINAGDVTIQLIPGAAVYNQFIYFIGATDGWTNAEQKLESPALDGIYTGYCYVADPNNWGLAFKFQRVAGSWDDQINAGTFETMEGATGTDNIEVAEEGVYYIEVNLEAGTLKATLVETMGIIGAFNGWGGDVEMSWNEDEYCYEATEAGVTADGWKFRVNNDWAINLGANDSVEPSTLIEDLGANGKNLGVAGSTIKLYPTRKTSDKIYCTVE